MNFDRTIQVLDQDNYSKLRLQPGPEDQDYLHLIDLRLALESIRTDERLKILDYGCGSSPYRPLFPAADYKRADFLDVSNLDYRLGSDSRVPEADSQFDLILSTQVLEHVPDPKTYLSECFRLLKPGGRLFLSTHGCYEDHGCPFDFHRWTADGLKLAMIQTGFQNIQIQKLTTGPRAALFMMGPYVHHFWYSRRTILGIILALNRWAFHRYRTRINLFCDRQFSDDRLVPADKPGHNFYICLAAQAQRPR